MNILAIDYGTKTIGLAWCDVAFGAVLPYGTIEDKTNAGKVAKLAALIESEKIDRLVVGFPLGLNGKENANTERVKKFIFEVQKISGVEVVYHDERFSSFGADNTGGGVSRDERAAMFILEGYLETLKKKK